MKYAALLLLTLFFACAQDKSSREVSAAPPEESTAEAPADAVDSAMAMPAEEAPVLLDQVEEVAAPKMPKPSASSAPKAAPMPPKSKGIDMNEDKEEEAFLKTGRAGIPIIRYATAQECLVRSKSSFTVNLQPNTATDLVSFVVYASDCGGLNLTISGPEFKETAEIVLKKGKNVIDLEDSDIRLRAGVRYTMTGTGIAGLGGCGSTKPPMFEDVSKCTNVVSENHPNLTVDQKKMPCVFELRFMYQ